jgi:hypothetical protein
MPIVLRRELAIPLWGVAFCAVAFSDPQRVMPFLMALLGIGVIASTIPAIVRRFGPSRRAVEVLLSLDDKLPAPARKNRGHEQNVRRRD